MEKFIGKVPTHLVRLSRERQARRSGLPLPCNQRLASAIVAKLDHDMGEGRMKLTARAGAGLIAGLMLLVPVR
ncbi:MAG TPA: hypothetical protein VKA80_14275, partial [Beijerinckiaceae bacterium]|nr:hypothetical protein [Beijerinckiaceae bacterium]